MSAKVLVWLCLVGMLASRMGASAADNAPTVETATVASGLAHPWGIAIQPGSFDVLVSETSAGQITRISPAKNHQASPAITGFGVESENKPFGLGWGPLGLAFLDRVTLAVGEGSHPRGEDLIRVYTLPDDNHALTVDAAAQKLGPIAAGAEAGGGEGDFLCVANSPSELFVVGEGDREQGWILRAALNGVTAGQLKTFVKTKPDTGAIAPNALAISKRGEIVLGLRGTLDKPNDSVLAFYNGRSGKLLLRLETQLNDVAGLAYHPRSGLLYAIDLSWSDPSRGGLYRLDSVLEQGRQAIRPLRVATLERPTSMAFAPDGTLYVTVLGADVSPTSKSGQVIRIRGEL